MGPIRVLIVDDHEVVREGLRAMIEDEEGIQVIGEAGDGAEALAIARELNPDLVLMDIQMPRLDGVETTRRLKTLLPKTSVVMISVFDDDSHVIEAIRAGAAGYILKDCSRDLLVHTVMAVSAGGVLLKSELLQKALESIASHHTQGAGEIPAGADTLTAREIDVLKLIVEGLTNKQIALELHLSEDTVKKHVQNLIAKLKASDRTQAAVKAVRSGIVKDIGV